CLVEDHVLDHADLLAGPIVDRGAFDLGGKNGAGVTGWGRHEWISFFAGSRGRNADSFTFVPLARGFALGSVRPWGQRRVPDTGVDDRLERRGGSGRGCAARGLHP